MTTEFKALKSYLQNPQPHIEQFMQALLGRETPRIPLVEYSVDPLVRRSIATNLLGRTWVDDLPETRQAYFDNFIAGWYYLGYDFVRFETGYYLPSKRRRIRDTAPGATSDRGWAEQHEGVIQSWADFEKYPWPKPADFDFSIFEYLNSHLPEGMGLLASHGGGILEHVTTLMSYEGLCLALYDQPDLVAAVTEKMGNLILAFYRHVLDLENLAAILQGDDMGFRTGTLIAPDHLRTIFLPWHARFARATHEKGLPYFLHSCGNVEAIMPDLLETVQIDGKHSFEDAILPVGKFYEKYHSQITVLGGVDVDLLTNGTPAQIARRTRALMEKCSSGRYAIGSGNSIPSYVPVENYLAMVDAALEMRE